MNMPKKVRRGPAKSIHIYCFNVQRRLPVRQHLWSPAQEVLCCHFSWWCIMKNGQTILRKGVKGFYFNPFINNLRAATYSTRTIGAVGFLFRQTTTIAIGRANYRNYYVQQSTVHTQKFLDVKRIECTSDRKMARYTRKIAGKVI